MTFKRNLILFFVFVFGMYLIYSGTKRILSFKTTAGKIEEAQLRLDQLKKENLGLRGELQYKSSSQFQEGEIRNKLGLVKPGEQLVILPKDMEKEQSQVTGSQKPNWEKWKELFFGS